MKTKKLSLLLFLFLSTAFLSQAQIKIGVVNGNELMEIVSEHSPLMEEVQSLIDQHANKLEDLSKEYNEMLEYYEKNKEEIDASWGTSPLAKREKELMDFYSQAQEEIDKKQYEVGEKLQQQIIDIITSVGKENGYTYIFDITSPLYTGADASSVTTDITAQVKAKLGY